MRAPSPSARGPRGPARSGAPVVETVEEMHDLMQRKQQAQIDQQAPADIYYVQTMLRLPQATRPAELEGQTALAAVVAYLERASALAAPRRPARNPRPPMREGARRRGGRPRRFRRAGAAILARRKASSTCASILFFSMATVARLPRRLARERCRCRARRARARARWRCWAELRSPMRLTRRLRRRGGVGCCAPAPAASPPPSAGGAPPSGISPPATASRTKE